MHKCVDKLCRFTPLLKPKVPRSHENNLHVVSSKISVWLWIWLMIYVSMLTLLKMTTCFNLRLPGLHNTYYFLCPHEHVHIKLTYTPTKYTCILRFVRINYGFMKLVMLFFIVLFKATWRDDILTLTYVYICHLSREPWCLNRYSSLCIFLMDWTVFGKPKVVLMHFFLMHNHPIRQETRMMNVFILWITSITCGHLYLENSWVDIYVLPKIFLQNNRPFIIIT